MAQLTIQQQIEKALAPFEARRDEINSRYSHAGKLRAESQAILNKYRTLSNNFQLRFSQDWLRMTEALAAGTADLGDASVKLQITSIEEVLNRSNLAADAAGLVLEQVKADELALLHECHLVMLPIWQQLMAELFTAMSALPPVMNRLGEAMKATADAGIRGLTCPISPSLLVPYRVDEPGTRVRSWFEANESMGLVRPGTLRRVA